MGSNAKIGGVDAEEVEEGEGSTFKTVRQLVGTKIVESNHPYGNGQDETTTVRFNLADEYDMRFDPACRSEAGMDYLEVTAVAPTAGTDRFTHKYSGQDGSWPCNEAIRVPGTAVKLHWHTDAAGVDWGYKVTIRGYRTLQLALVQPASWLEDLLRTVCRVVALGCRQLIMGETLTAAEGAEATMRWLTSPLLRNALENESALAQTSAETALQSPHVVNANAKAVFVKDMLKGTKGSDAAKLFHTLDKADKVLKTGGKWPLRAHRAVFATLLKHNGLLADAVSFARIDGGRASMASPEIRTAYSASRTVRDYLVQLHQETRAPYKELATDVYDKCRFLCTLRPFSESPVLVDGSAASTLPPTAASKDGALPAAPAPPKMERAVSANAKAGAPPPLPKKLGWATLRRQLSEGSSTAHKTLLSRVIVNTWQKRQEQLADGVSEGTGPVADSPNESVLSFVKSPVPIDQLREVLQRREQRVVHRQLGVQTATAVLQSNLTAPYVAKDVVKGIAYGLDEIARAQRAALAGKGPSKAQGDDSDEEEDGEGGASQEQDHEHNLGYFLDNLEACSPELVQRTRVSFHRLFAQLLTLLDAGSGADVHSKVLALRMLSLPFRVEDAKFLVSSDVFATLAKLMVDGSGDGDNDNDAATSGAGDMGAGESKGVESDSKEPWHEADSKEATGGAEHVIPDAVRGLAVEAFNDVTVADGNVISAGGLMDSGPGAVPYALAPFRYVPTGNTTTSDAPCPALPVDVAYFEYRIECLGERDLPGCCVGFTTFRNFPSDTRERVVGVVPKSLGFFNMRNPTQTNLADGTADPNPWVVNERWSVGDTIGVGIKFDEDIAFFTFNGTRMGGDVPLREELKEAARTAGVYPAVTIIPGDNKGRINLGPDFMFDVDALGTSIGVADAGAVGGAAERFSSRAALQSAVAATFQFLSIGAFRVAASSKSAIAGGPPTPRSSSLSRFGRMLSESAAKELAATASSPAAPAKQVAGLVDRMLQDSIQDLQATDAALRAKAVLNGSGCSVLQAFTDPSYQQLVDATAAPAVVPHDDRAFAALCLLSTAPSRVLTGISNASQKYTRAVLLLQLAAVGTPRVAHAAL